MKIWFLLASALCLIGVCSPLFAALDCRLSWDAVNAPFAPVTLDYQLNDYRSAKGHPSGERLVLPVASGRFDVYNPTAPFKATMNGRAVEVMAGRVEARDSESAETMFFEKSGGKWKPLVGAPVFQTQDPFVTKVGNELIVGGVETFPRPGGGLGYRTAFRRGSDLASLKPFTTGPEGMKDIRLLSLPDGKLLVMTRPQGAIGGRGKIGMTVIDGLEALNPESIAKATVYEDLFVTEEWGGANELHLLNNGLVGVLGHVAKFDGDGNRHYYPMAFAINPKTGHRSPMKILLERSNLPAGEFKRPDLKDVLFSGGLIRGPGGKAELYVGAGDAEVYRASIEDPFKDYENTTSPSGN